MFWGMAKIEKELADGIRPMGRVGRNELGRLWMKIREGRQTSSRACSATCIVVRALIIALSSAKGRNTMIREYEVVSAALGAVGAKRHLKVAARVIAPAR